MHLLNKGCLGIFAILSFVGCSSWTYNTSKVFSNSYDEVWEVAYQVLDRRYYIAKASKEEGIIETEWKEQKATFYLQGSRNKAYAKIEKYLEEEQPKTTATLANEDEEIEPTVEKPEPTEEKPQEKCIVKIGVAHEQNENLLNPYASHDAVWVPKGNNSSEERILMGLINAKLYAKQ